MESRVFWGNMSETSSSSEDETESSGSEMSQETFHRMEEIKVCGTHFQIPKGLGEDHEAFKEIFSRETWDSFSEQHRHHLMVQYYLYCNIISGIY